MPEGYIKQASVNTIVLAYYFAQSQTDTFAFTEKQLIQAFAGRLGAIRVSMALDTMKKNSYVADVNPSGNEWIFGLTPTGYAKAEQLYLSNENGIVRRIVEHGLAAYFESRSGESASEIPASDRYVLLSDNSAGYSEVLTSVENADEAIRGANDLGGEEKSWIRIHVDLGLALLKKGGTILQSALRSLLLEPLEAALKESSQDNIKKAVSAALHALRTYLGIF